MSILRYYLIVTREVQHFPVVTENLFTKMLYDVVVHLKEPAR